MYLLFIGTPIFLLEFGRVIRMCCGTNGACCRVFSIVLGFDRWKRGLMYCLVSVPLFMPDVSNTSAKIAGCLLFITGALYSAKTCQKKKVKMYVLNSPSAGGMQQNNPITYNTTSTTPQLKAFQDSSNLACMKCGEVVVSKENCDYSSFLGRGRCGESSVSYGLSPTQCAQATVQCASDNTDTTADKNISVLGATVPSADGENVTSIQLIPQKAASSTSLILVCGEDSQWIVERQSDDSASKSAVKITNPAVMHCITGEDTNPPTSTLEPQPETGGDVVVQSVVKPTNPNFNAAALKDFLEKSTSAIVGNVKSLGETFRTFGSADIKPSSHSQVELLLLLLLVKTLPTISFSVNYYKMDLFGLYSIWLTIFSLCFTFLPLFVVKDWKARGSAEGFSSVGFVLPVLMMSCWCKFGLLTNDKMNIYLNAFNLFFFAFYILAFAYYQPKRKYLYGQLISLAVTLYAVFTYVNSHPSERQPDLMAAIAAATQIVGLAGGIYDIKRAISLQTTEYIPAAIQFGIFLLTVQWTIFGIWVGNYYMTVANIAGLAVNVVTLVLYVVYPPKTWVVPIFGVGGDEGKKKKI
uniref:Sugar transporter SWEET1 n=1 Tax=Ditylenchus dipsaci TaxID=166011 RepID=A0A915D2D0_9BILA